MRFFIACLVPLFFSISTAWATPSFEHEKFNYETGQIIAVSETNYDASTFFFEAFTGSRYGHIGIVVVENGQVMVYESNPPHAQKTEIAAFLSRSRDEKGNFQATVLKLVKPLTATESASLVKAAKEIVAKKVPYNFEQTMNDKSLNCSEFVFKVFNSIKRTDVGEIQTIADLNRNSFGGQLLQYWEMLTDEPIDEEAKYVSPASIVFAKSTEAVAANLPHDRIISDKEVFAGWSTKSALITLDEQLFGTGDIEALKAQFEMIASDQPYKTL